MNVVLAAAGCVAPAMLASNHADQRRLAALTVYRASLLGMVAASALNAWKRGGPRHMLYRHLDHAAIFLMIAGTYTPFTVTFGGVRGRLLALMWISRSGGGAAQANHRAAPRGAPSLRATLSPGWTVLSDPGLLPSLPAPVVTLLVAGGVFYTVGITFHFARMRFQEAIWPCHYAAVVRIVA